MRLKIHKPKGCTKVHIQNLETGYSCFIDKNNFVHQTEKKLLTRKAENIKFSLVLKEIENFLNYVKNEYEKEIK